jgi:hypothetical protein
MDAKSQPEPRLKQRRLPKFATANPSFFVNASTIQRFNQLRT